MVGEPVAAREVVHPDDVEVAPRRVRAEVAVEQDDGDPGQAQRLDEAAVDLLAAVDVLEGGEEDAGRATADQLVAGRFRVLGGELLIRATAPPAPEQAEAADPRQAGQLAADDLEDLGPSQAGDEQPELAGRIGRARLADERARADPTLDKPLVLQVAEGAGDRRPRHAETLDELRLAGQAARRGVFPRGDLREECPGDLVVLGARSHRDGSDNRANCHDRILTGRAGRFKRLVGSFDDARSRLTANANVPDAGVPDASARPARINANRGRVRRKGRPCLTRSWPWARCSGTCCPPASSSGAPRQLHVPVPMPRRRREPGHPRRRR